MTKLHELLFASVGKASNRKRRSTADLMRSVATGLAIPAIALVGLLTTPVAEPALALAVRNESFNSSPSNWTALGDGVDSQTIGFSVTSGAGGTAGEARADLRRGTESYYADTDLGGTIATSEAWSATGKLDVVSLTGTAPDFGGGAFLGYFDVSNLASQTRAGILFNNSGSNLAWELRILDGNTNLGSTGFTNLLSTNSDTTFTVSWDPSFGANGRLSATIGATTVNLDPSGALTTPWDAFGFNKQGFAFIDQGADFRIDDLTYTAVTAPGPIPEPSTVGLVSLGLVLLLRGAQRRS